MRSRCRQPERFDVLVGHAFHFLQEDFLDKDCEGLSSSTALSQHYLQDAHE